MGNGRLGAMVYGDIKRERIQFNEDTFWVGEPSEPGVPGTLDDLEVARQLVFDKDFQSAHEFINKHLIGPPMMLYLPMGEMVISMKGISNSSKYRRSLDLGTVIATVEYEADGGKFKREVFSSPEDQVIVVYLETNSKQGFHCNLSFFKEITAHQGLFNRVELDLDLIEESALPTDERLKGFRGTEDPSLVALYFQYGRYLLISSSRPGWAIRWY